MELIQPGTSRLPRKYGHLPTPWGHPWAAGALKARIGTGTLFGHHTLAAAPAGFTCDYEAMMRPVRDQGQERSCGAHAWAALKEFNCIRWALLQAGWKPGEPLPAVLPKLGDWLSVAHLYANIRKAMGTFPEDSGTENATAGQVMQGIGVCPERFLPYRQDPRQQGDATCDAAGRPYRTDQGVLVPLDEGHIDAVLHDYRVIVFAFSVYESFEDTGSDGLVLPLTARDGLLGAHDTVLMGKRSDGRYKIRNSWSSLWGDRGHFYVTPAYLAEVGIEGYTTV